jgi:hypothetical protein
MLKVSLYSPQGEELCSLSPISVTIEMSLNVPAHSCEVIIPYENYSSCAELKITQNDDIVFLGVVDEEITTLSVVGKFKKYIARSKMALLLDNEACPIEISKATGEFLGSRYLTPLGISYKGGEKSMEGVITVEKGMTLYDVFSAYSTSVYDTLPYISEAGQLDFTGGYRDSSFSFGKDGVAYTELSVINKPCNVLSRVYMRLNSSGYLSHIDNPNAVGTGIKRERYIDCISNSSTTSATADKMIKNSNQGALQVKVTALGRLTNALGSQGVFKDNGLENESLVITELIYKYNSQKEITTVVLERKI